MLIEFSFLSIHLLMDISVACSFWFITNKESMNIHVEVLEEIRDIISLE